MRAPPDGRDRAAAQPRVRSYWMIIGEPIRIINHMGDAGEGLVDAESRLAERMDEREEEKKKARQSGKSGDPERARQLESCRLARTEMQRQLRSEEHTSELQSQSNLVCRLLLE